MIEKSATWAWYCRMSVGMPVAFAILSSKSVCAKLGATTASHDRCRKPPLIFLGLHPTCVLSPAVGCVSGPPPQRLSRRDWGVGHHRRAPSTGSILRTAPKPSLVSKAMKSLSGVLAISACIFHGISGAPPVWYTATFHFRWSSSTEKARVGTWESTHTPTRSIPRPAPAPSSRWSGRRKKSRSGGPGGSHCGSAGRSQRGGSSYRAAMPAHPQTQTPCVWLCVVPCPANALLSRAVPDHDSDHTKLSWQSRSAVELVSVGRASKRGQTPRLCIATSGTPPRVRLAVSSGSLPPSPGPISRSWTRRA